MTNDSFARRGGPASALTTILSSWAWVVVASLAMLAACGGSASHAPPMQAPGGSYRSDDTMADSPKMMAEPDSIESLSPPPSPPSEGLTASGMTAPSPSPAKGDMAGPKKRAAAGGGEVAPSTKSAGAKEPAVGNDKVASTPIAQMLIFTAQLRILVDATKFAARIDRVVDIATAMGGYISRHDNQSVTVRVPSSRFRDALKEMEKLGQVTHREIQAQDVSEEYHDLGVRLKSLRATRQRLEDFLKRAKNIQEVLRIEQELSRLNGEIDRIEGRMRFLSARATFSTITVSFQPKPKDQIAVDPEDPPPPPPPRSIPLPIDWLSAVGLDQLLQLR